MYQPPLVPTFENPMLDQLGDQALSRMSLHPLDPKHPLSAVAFQYNPTSYELQRKATWRPQNTREAPHASLHFHNCEADVLSMVVLLDSSERNCMGSDDINLALETIYAFTRPTKRPGNESRPPVCRLLWAQNPPFVGVVTAVRFNILGMTEAGAPFRAEVSLEMTGEAFSMCATEAEFFRNEYATAKSEDRKAS